MFSPPPRQGHRLPPQDEPQTLDWMKLEAPGLPQPIDIPFPDRKLPVCEVCKKNYKTRELCRTRDGHTDLPWTKTFICITFEESCFDSDGNIRDNKISAKALSTPQPYCYKKDIDSATPICACCKEKNYTRQYCREKLKHRQLPWGTVYVSLSIDRKGSKKIAKEGSSTRRTSKEGVSPGLKREAISDGVISPQSKKSRKIEEDDTVAKSSTDGATIKEEHEEDKDNNNIFTKIDDSRTFLAVVSSQSCKYEWLDFDKTAQPTSPSNQSPRQIPPYGDQYYDPSHNHYRGYYNYGPMYRSSQPPYPPGPPQPGYPSQPHQREQGSTWYGYQPYSPQGQPQPLHYQSSYPQYPYYPNMPPNPGMYHDQQPPPPHNSQFGGSGYPHPQSSPGPPQTHSSQYWQQYPSSSMPPHQHRQPPPPQHLGYNGPPPGYSHHPGPHGSPPQG